MRDEHGNYLTGFIQRVLNVFTVWTLMIKTTLVKN